MKHGLLLLAWLVCHASSATAQQLLCERQLNSGATTFLRATALVSWQPDSLRLVSDYYPTNIASAVTRVQRLRLSSCDTLPTGSTTARLRLSGISSVAGTNRRGQVLVTQQLVRPLAAGTNGDSIRIVLSLFNRDGSTRWRRVVPPQSSGEGVSGVIEAPGAGFFLFGGQSNGQGGNHSFVIRLDSLGQVQWRRTYGQRLSFTLSNPVYTRTGTLLLAVQYPVRLPVLAVATGVMEFNQQGDSLTTRRVVIRLLGNSTLPLTKPGSLVPLRDGGFALVGYADSTNVALSPFLARLDRNLNLVWSHVHRQGATALTQPRELADGSLVVVASNGQSGRGFPYWLFRFSAAGALQQRYPFVSQVLTANTGGGRFGFFGVAQGLQPLSDSSLVVVAGSNDINSSRIYLAHLRVPGLPRVVDSHVVPAAQPLAARPGRAAGAGLDLYPNPASEIVAARYAPAPGAATLELRDALGRVVLVQPVSATETETRLSVRALPAGLYFATMRVNGQQVARSKLVVTH
ncbi:MAG TPA: T9SS type A sorting domain-containing protein [Hymenobacter sp.]|jgi:hypothetical protein|uniref:T9SS type A sorting domain-containing protein n=1 Tax=Hymenobacter sp. TaxID=1898978 RepID=UPI002ED8363B